MGRRADEAKVRSTVEGFEFIIEDKVLALTERQDARRVGPTDAMEDRQRPARLLPEQPAIY